MQSIDEFQDSLKKASLKLQTKQYQSCLQQLKTLQSQVRQCIQFNVHGKNDRLLEIQIMVFNNLACAYQNKGKYKSSLYHLQIAQKLQTNYLAQKYANKDMPLQALQKLSTTYSNLSAVRSKLVQIREATKDIEFAIQILNGKQEYKQNETLTYLYYNYCFLLQTGGQLSDAIRYAEQGLKIAYKYSNKKMIEKYQQQIKHLRNKITRVDRRRFRQYRKYTKGQTGIIKTLQGFKKDDVAIKNIADHVPVTINLQQQPLQQIFSSQTPLSYNNAFNKWKVGTFYNTNQNKTMSNFRNKRKMSSNRAAVSRDSFGLKIGVFQQESLQKLQIDRLPNRTFSESKQRGEQIFGAYGITSKNKDYIGFNLGQAAKRFELRPHFKSNKIKSLSRGPAKTQSLQKTIQKNYLLNIKSNI